MAVMHCASGKFVHPLGHLESQNLAEGTPLVIDDGEPSWFCIIDAPNYLNWFYMKVFGKYIGPDPNSDPHPGSPLLLHSTRHESFLFTINPTGIKHTSGLWWHL